MKKTNDIVQTALFATLVFIATSSVRVPVMPGGGLIHTGTAVMFIIAVSFGPFKGALAGAIGMSLFNLTSEWAMWAPYTFVIRIVMGYMIGTIANLKNSRGKSWKLNAAAIVVSAFWFLPTSYVAQILIFGLDWRIPLLAIWGNVAQLILALVIGLPLIPRVNKLRDHILK